MNRNKLFCIAFHERNSGERELMNVFYVKARNRQLARYKACILMDIAARESDCQGVEVSEKCENYEKYSQEADKWEKLFKY